MEKLRISTVTAVLSALTLAVLGFIGGWQRRWMSDDGLIVLRTVRNLLAGNGPVFNAGERVESNTSTLWQYLIYVVAKGIDARLESIALWAALILTTLALLIAGLATAKLFKEPKQVTAEGFVHRAVVFLPLGGLIYIALPPARDFATSGLEWGLALFWLAVQWALLVWWGSDEGARRLKQSNRSVYALAFWSGLSWLVRPELALYGGVTGLVLLVAHRRKAGWILLAALPLPAGYQIFRMGYYGLLVPQTAVAKSASDSQWATGWAYVEDLVDAYNLYLGLALALVMGAFMLWGARQQLKLRSRTTVVVLMLVCAAIHITYVVKVGGDFMHGRMLLLPLFVLLLPVMVLKITVTKLWSSLLGAAGFVVTVVWCIGVVRGGHDYHIPRGENVELGVVDEREFWMQLADREKPVLYAEDLLSIPVMHDWNEAIARGQEENSAHLLSILAQKEPEVLSWTTVERDPNAGDVADSPLSVAMLNLGVTSMNTPLDVRVLDPMGLANPVAARQERIEGGRIGHDKYLPLEWQLADSATRLEVLPPWIDKEMAIKARQAIHTEDFQKLYASYRAPLTTGRFLANIKFALTTGRTLVLDSDPDEYAEAPSLPQPIYYPHRVHTDAFTPREPQ